MKKIVILLLISIFFIPRLSYAQLLPDLRKEIYQHKVMSFARMKHTGVLLTLGGVLLTAGGIAFIIDGSNNMNNTNYSSDPYGSDSIDEAGGGKIMLGTLVTCAGIVATSGGVVLWSIGSAKSRSYRQKLNSLSLNYNPGPRQLFSLAYRF